MAKGSGGVKFAEKYGVEATQIYKGDVKGILKSLKIPPSDHPLFDPTAPTAYDELRVAQIDSDGHMTTPIEVWSDPDEGILWVLDGRGRYLDVMEVNRRRAKEKREPIQPYLVPFKGDEKEAVARVRTKNYHRRLPTPSGMGLDIFRLRKAGWSWEECANKLHVETKDPEQWARKLLPLAFCIPEVRTAIDNKELPLPAARKFGGSAIDGENALSRQAQLDLLATMHKRKRKGDDVMAPKIHVRSAKVRKEVAMRLATSKGSIAAKICQATLDWVEGDEKAFESWPELKEMIAEILVKPPQKPTDVKVKTRSTANGKIVSMKSKTTDLRDIV